jgi:hypothetical protein
MLGGRIDLLKIGGDLRGGVNDGSDAEDRSGTIRGRESGPPFDGNPTYPFVAQQIGSFSYGGIVVPLTAGASNDTFALGKARPLGSSRSPLNADGFDTHVFEV